MPQWLVLMMQLLTVLPQITPELEAFIKEIIKMVEGGGSQFQAYAAAQAVVAKAAQQDAPESA